MTTAPSGSTASDVVQLSPSFNLPIALVVLAIPTLWLQPWVGGAIALFGLFLMIQAATLRLRFTDSALDIYRGDNQIRHFPYQDWQNWKIFWQSVPILFYFKEVQSIHFLPILFNPKTLKDCLEQHCPSQS
ncbi:MAG: DUF3119 family protein [Elainellaceae cyanobacterium]